ncbi:hypothetical protein [Deinococcus sp. SL84]|uniref:hypothetical protein n=1 Tax=Deinococcus sp. SL84 TaxID=2994663 RepID=UPI0022762E65|nr:hypothetical protein [Deinococcus sp. SL84]MCY1703884.1 hypothetical protein [Deinococcus sp. SL84]
MITESNTAAHPAPSRQPLIWAVLALLGILLTGLLGLLLIARGQTGSYLHKLPMFMLVLSPIPLSWLCAYATAHKEVRFSLFLRLFTAGTAYFTWYGLLSFIQMSWNGHAINVVFGGLFSILLAALPYLIWRQKKAQPE